MSYGPKTDSQDDGNFLASNRAHGITRTADTRLSSSMTVAYTGVRWTPKSGQVGSLTSKRLAIAFGSLLSQDSLPL